MPWLLIQLQTVLRHRERQQEYRFIAKVLDALPRHGLDAVLQPQQVYFQCVLFNLLPSID
ncbi:MAG: hypothetical protein BVN35_08105 [Proteobacteria bacterium ST_bin11]|nr:MAG: hypothetical protein BVN35_08105 [Proteobacteria bacterium ST_bin11]